eukprot:scaffold3068_cov269-Pinguiococcus_pyrenoidosus.AAC.7
MSVWMAWPRPLMMMLLDTKRKSFVDGSLGSTCVRNSLPQSSCSMPAVSVLVRMILPNIPPVPSRNRSSARSSSSVLAERVFASSLPTKRAL